MAIALEDRNKELIVAVRSGDVNGVINALENGADLYTQDNENYGMTPLHLAAFKGHYDIVKLLCERYGANINCFDNPGDTPLHDACRYGYENIIHYLLSKNPDTTITNKGGHTPADVLKKDIDNRQDILRLLGSPDNDYLRHSDEPDDD